MAQIGGAKSSSIQLSDVENELIAQTLLAVREQDSINNSPAYIRQRPPISRGPTIVPKGFTLQSNAFVFQLIKPFNKNSVLEFLDKLDQF